MPEGRPTVGTAGHVLEPADTWERDSSPGHEVGRRLAPLSLASQRKVLGEDVLRCCGIAS